MSARQKAALLHGTGAMTSGTRASSKLDCAQSAFAAKVLAKPATYVSPLAMGAFNMLQLIQVRTESSGILPKPILLVRLPSLGRAVFLEEKTLAEAATAMCISQRTLSGSRFQSGSLPPRH